MVSLQYVGLSLLMLVERSHVPCGMLRTLPSSVGAVGRFSGLGVSGFRVLE